MKSSLPFPKPARRKRQAVKVFPDGREVCDLKTRDGRFEYEHRLALMALRQNCRCPISGKPLGDDAQFDHEAGRGSGGGHRDDRIEVDGRWQNAALSPEANMLKGSRRYTWFQGRYMPESD